MKLDTLNLDPKVYRRAAELVLCGECVCCCPAISMTCLGTAEFGPDYKVAFAEFFRPPGMHFGNAWWTVFFDTKHDETRVIALLLMAEIVADAKRTKRGKARRA